MKRIGLLSDTHGWFDPRFYDYFREVDQIWHAGDIGSASVLDSLEAFKPTVAVWGNVDDYLVRKRTVETARFICEGVDVLITHIGGYPGNYSAPVKKEVRLSPPRIFISGHSHILKVMNDPRLGLLHLNPGAAGRQGFHAVRTALRFTLCDGNISDLEVIELTG